MNFLRSLFVSFLLLVTVTVYAQKAPMKFGKVPAEDMTMTVYEGDSSASAVVLADYGVSSIVYNKNQGFFVSHKRHKRIKILSTDGYDYADVTVLLYNSTEGEESLSGLKAVTYNLEGGKIQSTKMDRGSIFREKYNSYYDQLKFTFPNVKEGSVIEYSYSISSPFIYNFQDWQFQEDIPVRWSEYRAKIPEYYRFEKFMQGYHPLAISDSEVNTATINFQSSNRGFNGTTTGYSSDNVEYRRNDFRWVAKDVPAFIEEPYMTSRYDYYSKINFELGSVNFPNSAPQQIMGTWARLNKTMLDNSYFGGQLKNSGFMKDEVEAIGGSEQEKAAGIYSMIRNHMTFNGKYRKYVTESLRKAFSEKTGSSADINLMLVAAMRRAGLKSDPVLLSTRANGFVRETMAISSQFNYVIALVEFSDGTTALLDATDRNLPANLLPQRCLNGNGRRISTERPGWVSLTTGANTSEMFVATLDLSDDGSATAVVDARHTGYGARQARGAYFSNSDEYKKYLEESSGWSVTASKVGNEKDLSKPFTQHIEYSIDAAAESLGDIIYVNPIIKGRLEENPFKTETRDFPVDFTCPLKETYMVTMNIPEGFVVDEIPEQKVIGLPNNAGRYMYTIQSSGNQVMVRSILSINKNLFTGEGYPILREFFAQIVEKQAEQLVLKRAN